MTSTAFNIVHGSKNCCITILFSTDEKLLSVIFSGTINKNLRVFLHPMIWHGGVVKFLEI